MANLADDETLTRRYTLGAAPDSLVRALPEERLDFTKVFEALPTNPWLVDRRIAKRILTERSRSIPVAGPPEAGGAPGAGVAPASVDWRNRFGWPWITTIRDQDGCEACWVFASVALVEAMVRIDHCVFPRLSEGDVHKGIGAHCCDCGNAPNALNWIQNHAAADVGCFAWPVTTSACQGCGKTGGAPYDAIAYTPTSDRSGRSVRIPAYSTVNNVADQKTWLDVCGPLVCSFDVYADFMVLGSGIYHQMSTSYQGGHIMLIIGYDDTQGCWIVKNSWGTTWGASGYCRIKYGECNIDAYAKYGLTAANPDPWTKRRQHGGNLIESGNGGTNRNFEMLSANGGPIKYWWRDNAAPSLPWAQAKVFGNDARHCPAFTGTTYNRNFELIYWSTAGRLHHWWFDQNAQTWCDGGLFGPTDAAGVPGFIQGNYGAPGNFEVVVRTSGGQLVHWWRDNGGATGWHESVRFGSNIAQSGPALVQSHYGTMGNFELVAVRNDGQMQHWWRDNDHGGGWNQGVTFGAGVNSPPCMIEGSYGQSDELHAGNFELCVAVNGQVQHWWRDNQANWHHDATFGHDIAAVAGLLEGSYGFNLEVIVLRTDGQVQHYWRASTGNWFEGAIIGPA